jgi:hypothetical protein
MARSGSLRDDSTSMGATDSRDRGNGLLSGADMEALKKLGEMIADGLLAVCIAAVGWFMSIDDESSDTRR